MLEVIARFTKIRDRQLFQQDDKNMKNKTSSKIMYSHMKIAKIKNMKKKTSSKVMYSRTKIAKMKCGGKQYEWYIFSLKELIV